MSIVADSRTLAAEFQVLNYKRCIHLVDSFIKLFKP